MLLAFEDILKSSGFSSNLSNIGSSREGRLIEALRIGSGKIQVSLIAGAHAEEPVGPMLLRLLCQYLQSLDRKHPFLTKVTWSIIPHINPDGEEKAKLWWTDNSAHYNLGEYLKYSQRELPGDDIEFGYPLRSSISNFMRPENDAAFSFWSSGKMDYHLHVSLLCLYRQQ